jgi:hypothetical protein
MSELHAQIKIGVEWAMTDSNPRHSRCKRDALPTELIALFSQEYILADIAKLAILNL